MNSQQIAQHILAADPVFLDTETTGLSLKDQIVEIAIIDRNGTPILNNLIKSNRACHPRAQELHGIRPSDLEDHGLEWNGILELINSVFKHHPVAIYNAVFDTRLIRQTCTAHCTEPLRDYRTFDIMELANRHFINHATWCEKDSRFKRLSLLRCCELAGIKFDGSAHRAIVDCHATLDLLKFIAQDTQHDDDVQVLEARP